MGGRLGRGLVPLGGLALAHAGLGLAVGEDRPEVALDRVGVHPGLVSLSEPLLGGRGDREQVGLALPASDRVHLVLAGADRQHHRCERGVQVGADPGGHAGALARVGVQRLQARERAGVHLADVLVDRLDVGPTGLRGERDGEPAGEVQLPALGGHELAGDRGELLPPAAGDDVVQALHDRLGAEERGDLRAAVGDAGEGDLGHGAKADRAGRERPAQQFAGLGVSARTPGGGRDW